MKEFLSIARAGGAYVTSGGFVKMHLSQWRAPGAILAQKAA
jgi:hypothetical protein